MLAIHGRHIIIKAVLAPLVEPLYLTVGHSILDKVPDEVCIIHVL